MTRYKPRSTRMVYADLRRRERSRRLRDWRRMVERYIGDELISRRAVRCPRCGRTVDMFCLRCAERSDVGEEPAVQLNRLRPVPD